MTTTISQPKRHASSLFHRHHSSHTSKRQSEEHLNEQLSLFEGTDTITQNRRVALQRVLEVHDALELKHQNETPTSPTSTSSERPSSSSSISSDPFTIDFSEIPFPDAEVRSFRYFIHLWDPSVPADPDFDEAIAPTRSQFEEMALKHFFRRIALWNASEESKENMSRSVWRRRERSKNQLGKSWTTEKEQTDHSARDELKEVTTQEGLAQLLWTLLHDPNQRLAPELMAECTDALKRMYGMKC
ncbi:hypothetical protein T440DRAFT_294644 [Plenodomus tracheiphilus IPT5]|uniref:Uncharacterized protein n=1 Tax=Plenodomus tracheiphilus IPT5 TaxID=1408161 RepID=A0A6A7BF28_9PLEO|nr:hypothetical protein T440DRAFT_294644 [Plenodomus tracheiphilus IPT5]